MDALVFLDKQFTLWMNSFFSDYFDIFFYQYTSTIVWIPLYLAMAWLIFSKQGVRGVVTLFFIAVLILLADQIASGLCKPLFERFRPSRDGVMQYLVHIVNDYRGGRYGFMSSHAANTFALSTFMALVIRNRFLGWSMFIWALFTGYSRIYCGVHYVGDVLCGALLGIIVGAVVYQFYLRSVLRFFVVPHYNKRTFKSNLAGMFGTWEPTIVGVILWTTIAVMLLASALMIKWHGAAC
jgi:undecaprenyl-diphosphatase